MNKDFKNLNLMQLNIMLKHIRLGRKHLEEVLSPEQLQELLKKSEITSRKKKNIKPDTQEKSGNITLATHTVITGFLGATLGFCAFTGLKLHSAFILFSILAFVLSLSMWIGYCSCRLTKKKASDNMFIQKLCSIELQILQQIKLIHEKELTKISRSISENMHFFSHKTRFNFSHHYNEIFLLVAHFIEHRADKNHYSQAKLLLQDLQKLTIDFSKEEQCYKKTRQNSTIHEPNSFSTYVLDRGTTGANTYTKTLSTPGFETVAPVPTRPIWIKNNLSAIVIGVTPTFAGSFGSMFVFLTGVPTFLEVFRIKAITFVQHEVWITGCGVIFALMLTCYYCYSYIHSNYKEFLRLEEIEKTKKQIAEESEKILKTTTRFNYFVQINTILKQLSVLLKPLKSPNKSY